MSEQSFNIWREGVLIRDSPDWKVRRPLGPVSFDVRCAYCDFQVDDIGAFEFPESPAKVPGFMEHRKNCGHYQVIFRRIKNLTNEINSYLFPIEYHI